MIHLYSFNPGFGVSDPSPFVLKIETYMRLADIKYKSIHGAENLSKAPKKKLPFITDDQTTLADSEFIISYLQQKFQVDLDSNLSTEQKASAYLIGKSLDENLYWCLVHSRWAKDDTWIHVKKEFFDSMPFPLKLIVPVIARQGVTSALKKQGLGRHTNDEINQIADKTFQALSDLLANKKYFFGETPCTFDATAFGFLAQFITVSLDNEMNDLVRKYNNLVAYCEHMNEKYY